MITYLDSSAMVKRYVIEPGTDIISRVYSKALMGETIIAISLWNIGEVLGVLDKYYRRRWLDRQDYEKARLQFIAETLKLLRLKVLRVVPLKARILLDTWLLIEKHHLYEADALQIVTARYVNADSLYTGDKKLHEIAVNEGIKSVYLGS